MTRRKSHPFSSQDSGISDMFSSQESSRSAAFSSFSLPDLGDEPSSSQDMIQFDHAGLNGPSSTSKETGVHEAESCGSAVSNTVAVTSVVAFSEPAEGIADKTADSRAKASQSSTTCMNQVRLVALMSANM